MIKYRMFRFVLFGVIGLAIGGLISLYQINAEKKIEGQSIVASNFGGPLDLIDQDGKPFTDADFEADKYRLIYFGFTYCPAICPTELQRIATILKDLGDQGENITPVFITVDPERDTSSVMKQYTAMFHPRLIGLTGNQAQIDQAKKSYKIYAAKVQDETMSDYTMDHSSFIYFLNPQNDLLRVFKTDDSTEDMTKVIRGYL